MNFVLGDYMKNFYSMGQYKFGEVGRRSLLRDFLRYRAKQIFG